LEGSFEIEIILSCGTLLLNILHLNDRPEYTLSPSQDATKALDDTNKASFLEVDLNDGPGNTTFGIASFKTTIFLLPMLH
jgi:hypothetical protein